MRGVVPIRLSPLAGVLLYVNFTYLHFLVLAIHCTLPYHTRNCYKSTELKSEGPKKWIEPTTVFPYILKLIAININAQCTLLCKPIYCLAFFLSIYFSLCVRADAIKEVWLLGISSACNRDD